MAVLENITKAVAETAKAAAKKSSDIVEGTRLNINIGAEEEKIRKVQADMGKAIYETFKSGGEISESLKEYCERIQGIEKNIEDMKQKILEMKNIKVCPTCSEELDIDMAYCFKCGQKQEEINDGVSAAEPEAQEVQGEVH